MTTETPPPARTPSLYARLWAGVPRELGFLLPLLPIVVVATTVLWSLLSAGIGLIPIVVGLFVVIAALFTARGLGVFELLRLRAAGMRRIVPPAWDRKSPAPGFWGKVFAPVIDGHYWLYLLHGLVVNLVVGTITWSLTIAWVSASLGGLSYWIWDSLVPNGERDVFPATWLLTRLGLPLADADPVIVDRLAYFALGAVFVLTLPFVTRGLVLVHQGIARGMLGAFASEELERRVASLSESRTAAVAAEGTALRRLERDIHDGPQQRLVRMQMDLAAADRKLADDPEAARALVAEAAQHARDALEELRALSRGFAPPILLDRGLVAALRSLAVRNPLPTTVVSELPEGIELPPELERNAYFIVAEALTNASKHSGGTAVELRLRVEPGPGPDESWLVLEAADDGRGGAAPQPNHGLAGLDERTRGLGGSLSLSSPAGGPTVLTARLPLPPTPIPSPTSPRPSSRAQ